MSIAKVTEIKSSSKVSFDDALKQGIAKASKTIHNISGAWISAQEVGVKDGEITDYRVLMKITFILK